ncbi:MAG: ribonuclease VapC [Acetobacteraceae bacterium]|nr:ribonuclease VapC [Acetobacteraceae bacterium]
MTIFADASALIAIITGEDGADTLADALDSDQRRLCSAISVWETTAGLCRSYAFPIPAAHARVKLFLDAGRFQFVEIGESEWVIASEAYAQFGNGRHPAALNMGDCFAYACARVNRARLLHKGGDFRQTDIG